MAPVITRHVRDGVALLGDDARPGGVTFAFTERTGGVSEPPYASLNLGSRCGDDAVAVAKNRRRALRALGAEDLASALVEPRQVHGDRVVVVRGSEDGRATDEELARARACAVEGADAIVCSATGVPVLLCFADCVPVVICAPGAFAVIHSGWRGTIARISAKALGVLCHEAGCVPADVSVYVGPHITGEDYEVSPELLARFVAEFGPDVAVPGKPRHLSLGRAIARALGDAGVSAGQIAWVSESTASATDRFYSYRAEGGTCGRHAAIAYL